MRFALSSATLILISLSAPALAWHCEEPTTSPAEIDTCLAPRTPSCVYVDIDPCQPECGPLIWVYQESNGVPGLQRGDEIVDDTCHGEIEADTIVF